MTDRTDTGTTGTLRIDRILRASPDRVFAAWTDPTSLAAWMSPVGHAEVAADVRVGGSFTVAMVGDGRRIEHTGEYLEIDPPRRLRFSWRSPYTGPEAGVVTVEIAPVPEGTRLVLTHERLPAEAVDGHASGWGTMVERLGVHLAERAP
jgi:uncharacterized protein YndB with AHSA1/START domain